MTTIVSSLYLTKVGSYSSYWSIYLQVGTTTMSCTEALKAGLRGKALKIAHYYGDLLWQVFV